MQHQKQFGEKSDEINTTGLIQALAGHQKSVLFDQCNQFTG